MEMREAEGGKGMQRAATLPQVPAPAGVAPGVETDQRLLGELLLEKGAIEPQELEMALARQAATKKPV